MTPRSAPVLFSMGKMPKPSKPHMAMWPYLATRMPSCTHKGQTTRHSFVPIAPEEVGCLEARRLMQPVGPAKWRAAASRMPCASQHSRSHACAGKRVHLYACTCAFVCSFSTYRALLLQDTPQVRAGDAVLQED